jgi:hypothetical protein
VDASLPGGAVPFDPAGAGPDELVELELEQADSTRATAASTPSTRTDPRATLTAPERRPTERTCTGSGRADDQILRGFAVVSFTAGSFTAVLFAVGSFAEGRELVLSFMGPPGGSS